MEPSPGVRVWCPWCCGRSRSRPCWRRHDDPGWRWFPCPGPATQTHALGESHELSHTCSFAVDGRKMGWLLIYELYAFGISSTLFWAVMTISGNVSINCLFSSHLAIPMSCQRIFPINVINQILLMNITPDLQVFIIHSPMKGLAYTWTNIVTCLKTHNYFVKQISHLSNGVVTVALALCQVFFKN